MFDPLNADPADPGFERLRREEPPGRLVPRDEEEHLLRDCTTKTDMGGRQLCPADKIVFGISSANRDEMHFEDPHHFRLDREDPRRHLAFGGGPHICPGASLARLEARVALQAFLDRVAAVRPLEPARYEGVPVLWAHGPRTLMVELDAA